MSLLRQHPSLTHWDKRHDVASDGRGDSDQPPGKQQGRQIRALEEWEAGVLPVDLWSSRRRATAFGLSLVSLHALSIANKTSPPLPPSPPRHAQTPQMKSLFLFLLPLLLIPQTNPATGATRHGVHRTSYLHVLSINLLILLLSPSPPSRRPLVNPNVVTPLFKQYTSNTLKMPATPHLSACNDARLPPMQPTSNGLQRRALASAILIANQLPNCAS